MKVEQEMNSHPNLASAYRQGLLDLLQDGRPVPSVQESTSPASGFGVADRPSVELIGYSFEVTNPFACLVDSEARTLRLPYCVGSLLWTLAGSDDLEHLQQYHPDARNFSDDGISLSGAFGKRLFRNQDQIDEIDAIIKRLRVDPASRRTFAAICDAEDNIRQSREYPCCIGLQYFLREGALHSITYMRAQHALLILPYDAFLFMALQCIVAARLGATIGTYKHICGTFHIYEAEREFTERVLSEPLHSIEFGRPEGSESELIDLLQFEKRVRDLGRARDVRGLIEILESATRGSDFAHQAKLVLLAHWFHLIADAQENVALDGLPEPMKLIMRRQWRSTSRIARSN
jgi:thymidylate synthase